MLASVSCESAADRVAEVFFEVLEILLRIKDAGF